MRAYAYFAGGAAGLALAVRLSEDPTQKVLVLEAGPSPEVASSYSTPGASQAVLGEIKAQMASRNHH